MNKIININLAGRLIPVEEPAYEALHIYIERLKNYFSREPGGEEIIHDMEDRIGELFQERIRKGAACISTADVQAVIAVMGSPEQLISETSEDSQETNNNNQEGAPYDPSYHNMDIRKLRRSEQEKVMGGVCGGIGIYLKTDPAIIRILFALITIAWGTGIIIYLLLWIFLPIASKQQITIKKRLYRNPDKKIVGGVCAGIAAYLDFDAWILRLIILAPLFGFTLFEKLSDNLFFPVFAGGVPSMLILYIIIWISLPEANTVTEKLEMRGATPDVQNISRAIKTQPGQTLKKKNNRNRIWGLLAKGLVLTVLVCILLILSTIIIMMLTGLLGIAATSSFLFPLAGLITAEPYQQILFWIFSSLLLVIPCILLIRLFIRLVSGRKSRRSGLITTILIVLFVTSIFGLVSTTGAVISDFKAHYSTTAPLLLEQPDNDSLYIRQAGTTASDNYAELYDWCTVSGGIRFINDSSIAIRNINFRVDKSPDSLYHLLLERNSRGGNAARAETLALAPAFSYRQEGNTLYLPADFVLPEGTPFRGQQLTVRLQVPVGKVFHTDQLVGSYHSKRSYSVRNGHFSYKVENTPAWEDDTYYEMQLEGFRKSGESADANPMY